jgi:glutaconate CoA-transferase, subunit B
LQAGRVDVGFLGAAQMDRYGNINTTVLGPYENPKVRLPGAGGAPEIAASAREVVIILRQKPRSFVEEIDFVTSVGHRYGGDSRGELGYDGAGPSIVITDLGILRPDPETKELTMTALHPGTTVEEAKEATGWELKVADELETTDPPTERELKILRDIKARTEASRKKA